MSEARNETTVSAKDGRFMKFLDLAFREFVDALETAHDEGAFKRAADYLAAGLGYRWFA